MENKYKVYGLIHPKTNQICYIGYTKQLLNKRLSQHNCPKKNNMCYLAKCKRSLKNEKFNIVLLKNYNTEEEMLKGEIDYISYYKSLNYKLYNLQEGGNKTSNTKESLKRMIITRNKNNKWHSLKGEDHGQSLLSEIEVLDIYKLIKEFKSNRDILIDYPNLKRTTLNQIRKGKTWKHLFVNHFTKSIPSLKNFSKHSYSSNIKIEIIKLINNNIDLKDINIKYNALTISDLNRIKCKQIWIPVWKLYEEYYKCL